MTNLYRFNPFRKKPIEQKVELPKAEMPKVDLPKIEPLNVMPNFDQPVPISKEVLETLPVNPLPLPEEKKELPISSQPLTPEKPIEVKIEQPIVTKTIDEIPLSRKLIRANYSLALIVPSNIVKDYKLQAGDFVDLKLELKNESKTNG
jgi:hypothetical protein